MNLISTNQIYPTKFNLNMIKYFPFLILFFIAHSSVCFAQNTNPQLDTALASRLGADEFGMKMYVFVILKSGPHKSSDKAFVDSCFQGHLANIRKLAEEKKLVIAGPFEKNNADYRGLFILNVKTKEEANQLLATDPAIRTNLLSAELFPWYGSAAISEYLPQHDKIWKINP